MKAHATLERVFTRSGCGWFLGFVHPFVPVSPFRLRRRLGPHPLAWGRGDGEDGRDGTPFVEPELWLTGQLVRLHLVVKPTHVTIRHRRNHHVLRLAAAEQSVHQSDPAAVEASGYAMAELDQHAT